MSSHQQQPTSPNHIPQPQSTYPPPSDQKFPDYVEELSQRFSQDLDIEQLPSDPYQIPEYSERAPQLQSLMLDGGQLPLYPHQATTKEIQIPPQIPKPIPTPAEHHTDPLPHSAMTPRLPSLAGGQTLAPLHAIPQPSKKPPPIPKPIQLQNQPTATSHHRISYDAQRPQKVPGPVQTGDGVPIHPKQRFSAPSQQAPAPPNLVQGQGPQPLQSHQRLPEHTHKKIPSQSAHPVDPVQSGAQGPGHGAPQAYRSLIPPAPARSPPQLPPQPIIGHTISPQTTPSRERPTSKIPIQTASPRGVSTTPPANKLQKHSQPDLLKPLPKHESPDLSPQNSPLLRPVKKRDSLIPPTMGDLGTPRAVSSPSGSRPNSEGPPESKLSKRRSWLPGARSRSNSINNMIPDGPKAWLIAGDDRIEYPTSALTHAQKVPELWDQNGDTYVYLYPKSSGRGPSFKIPSLVISSSPVLMGLAFEDLVTPRARAKSFDGRKSLAVEDANRALYMRTANAPSTPPYTPRLTGQENAGSSDGSAESIRSLAEFGSREGHLYFPQRPAVVGQSPEAAQQEQGEYLVSVRNLFAFLVGQPLVATKSYPTVFAVFILLSGHLGRLGFSNVDGSTFGEAVTASLSRCMDELRLDDVRNSREKTIQGIILGERMRSMELYNEAFTHCVGKYMSVKEFEEGNFEMITPNSRNRIERAFIDLEQRQQCAALRLNVFDVPSLFAGFASSTTSEESKFVHFNKWKSSYSTFRKYILSYYKDLHGSWPPKASSKKNTFSESGLNRLVLRSLYHDFGSLYDLLVDRESLTTRSLDADDVYVDGDPTAAALRKLLSEFDHSSPPIQPPVPFDVPRVPTMVTLAPNHLQHTEKVRQQAETRKLQQYETLLLLTKSHNLDSNLQTPFLTSFRAFEEKEARGKNAIDLADQRYGYWLFVYIVLQSLPMLVVDAPGLRNTTGVEYFLCEPPKGGAPWMEDTTTVKRSWYGVAGGSGVVSLPSDVVDYGVEGVYRRSHCWLMAEKWLGHLDAAAANAPVEDPKDIMSPLEPPPGFGGQLRSSSAGSDPGSQGTPPRRLSLSPIVDERTRSRSQDRNRHRQSVALGLEQLPLPSGFQMEGQFVLAGPRSRSSSFYDNTGAGLGNSDSMSNLSGATGQGIARPTYVRGRSSSSVGDASHRLSPGQEKEGKSFDDILNELQTDGAKGKAKKKKGLW